MTAGETVSGINYRLTPRDAPHMIDEVLVVFADVDDAEARERLRAADCIVKDVGGLGDMTMYTVDIPDDRNVADMIAILERIAGVKYASPNHIVTLAVD